MEEITVTLPAWAVAKIEAVATSTGKTVDEVCTFFISQEVPGH